MSSETILNVAVSGAAGQIAYSLLPLICSGKVFGERRINLRLLDLPRAMEVLSGVRMELQDCSYRVVNKIICTSNLQEAFENVHAVFLIGSYPHKEGMERKDLIYQNTLIFKEQGRALNDYANRNVKVLVVANPANTNAWTTMKHAPSLPRENFTALTRLDHERIRSLLTDQLKEELKTEAITADDVSRCISWGNHSSTMVPDISHALLNKKENIDEILHRNPEWDNAKLMKTIQDRWLAVFKARKLTSALSPANASALHMRDWFDGTPEGEYISVGMISDKNSYGIEEDLMFSFPARCINGKFERIENLKCSEEIQTLFEASAKELREERQIVLDIIMN